MKSEQIFKAAVKARKMRKLCLESAKAHNISFNELEILNFIADKTGITPADISRNLFMEPAIVSRKLKTLSNKNLLAYKHNTRDRRVINIDISKEGKRLLKIILNKI